MSVLTVITCVVYILLAIALVTLILLQKKRSAGMGGITGGGQGSTYYDKNKSRSLDGTLERYTKIGIVALIIITAATWFINAL